MQPCPRSTPVPYFHLHQSYGKHTHINIDTHTHTSAHSLSPGGCFRCSHRRCRSDNRLWQMSRHHLKAVTCSRIETNQRCHCVARFRLVWRQTLLSISCFTITRSVSLVLSLVIRSDLRAVSLPEGRSVRLAVSCLLSFTPVGLLLQLY